MRYATETSNCFLTIRLLALLALSLVLPCQLYGQVAGATLSGKVSDPSGAVMPGTGVSITNTGTGITRNVTTSASGSYSRRTCWRVPTK